MDYKESLEYLYSRLPMFSRVGAAAYKPGLQTTEALDTLFGHPHRRFKSIHVAGTNGKGSTSHMLASVLQEQGYKVGLYTSPHLADFRERIRVGGRMISREAVVDFVERWRQTETDLTPSFFELTMMMAFDYFARERVDYAVVEVGMGGRLDSTNVITPLLCTITNISKDHTQFLGATLPDIAREKAGIIKSGIPVVIGESMGEEVDRVFAERAAEVGAPLTAAYADATFRFEDYDLPLHGDYQRKNLRTVVNAVRELRNIGVEISDKSLHDGIRNVVVNTGLMGRWTELSKNPLVIADTGHNIAGLGYNIAQLQEMEKGRHGPQVRVVMGFVADKAIDDILAMMPRHWRYYITNAAIPRALPVKDLEPICAKHSLDCQAFASVEEAYRQALADMQPDDILYVGGSTFIVADLLQYLQR